MPSLKPPTNAKPPKLLTESVTAKETNTVLHYWTAVSALLGLIYNRTQQTLFEAGLLFSFLSLLTFLNFSFFCKPADAVAPHYNCGSCIRGQAKQSSHCSAHMCVVSDYTHVSRWDKIRWLCNSNLKSMALCPNFSRPQVRKKSPRNEVEYDFLIKLAFNFNLCISFSFP